MFIAPITIPANTVQNLDGYANKVDYDEIWVKLPAYQRAIYYFGDFNCHQKSYRSFSLNGNQMPVDARMASIFIFVNLGIITAMFTEPSISIRDGIINVFPKKVRLFIHHHFNKTLFLVLLILLFILPVALDGFHQLLTPYESTNLKRVLTGIPMGWLGGFFVGVAIISTGKLRSHLLKVRNQANIENKSSKIPNIDNKNK
jgi:uncharacterized membrane protein